MPYLQLGNGQTKKLSNDEITEMYGDESPRVYRADGVEHMIVGIHPDEVEYQMTPEEKATSKEAAKAKADKKQAKKDKRDSKENPDNTDSVNEKVASE